MNKQQNSRSNHSTAGVFSPRVMFWTGVVMLTVSAVLLMSAIGIENRSKQDISVPTTPYNIGQPISMGSVELNAESVTFNPGQRSFAAPEGKQYAVVTLHVKNKSDKPINVLPSTDTYLKDSSGNVVYLTPAIVENPFKSGELLPGDEIRGQLSYLISKNEHYKLFIDAIWSGGVLPIAIN